MRRSPPVARLFGSGLVVDGILGLMLAEWLILILVRKNLARGPRPVEILASLGAGAALLLALRAALLVKPWPSIAPWLVVALGCHLADLRWRWSHNHN
jgi:CBS-domain-containing membrane protein